MTASAIIATSSGPPSDGTCRQTIRACFIHRRRRIHRDPEIRRELLVGSIRTTGNRHDVTLEVRREPSCHYRHPPRGQRPRQMATEVEADPKDHTRVHHSTGRWFSSSVKSAHTTLREEFTRISGTEVLHFRFAQEEQLTEARSARRRMTHDRSPRPSHPCRTRRTTTAGPRHGSRRGHRSQRRRTTAS